MVCFKCSLVFGWKELSPVSNCPWNQQSYAKHCQRQPPSILLSKFELHASTSIGHARGKLALKSAHPSTSIHMAPQAYLDQQAFHPRHLPLKRSSLPGRLSLCLLVWLVWLFGWQGTGSSSAPQGLILRSDIGLISQGNNKDAFSFSKPRVSGILTCKANSSYSRVAGLDLQSEFETEGLCL